MGAWRINNTRAGAAPATDPWAAVCGRAGGESPGTGRGSPRLPRPPAAPPPAAHSMLCTRVLGDQARPAQRSVSFDQKTRPFQPKRALVGGSVGEPLARRAGRPRGRGKPRPGAGWRRPGANAGSLILGMPAQIALGLVPDARDLQAMNGARPAGRHRPGEVAALAVVVSRGLSRLSCKKTTGALAETPGGA